MQVKNIELRERYAVKHQGREVGMYCAEIRTVRDTKGTTNYVVGAVIVPDAEDGERQRIAVEVKDVIDLLDRHEALAKAKAEQDAAKKVKELKQTAKQEYAVTLLARAIGAQSVLARYAHDKSGKYVDWDEDKPAVLKDYSGIELNEHAIEPLIKFLEETLKTNNFLRESANLPPIELPSMEAGRERP